jgi:NADH-ubiquinone oxidoreductase chain 2
MFTNSINHLQKNIHSTFINRITIITLLISVLFTFNSLNFQSIGKGISIYSGLYQITVQSHIVEMLLLIVGISILLGWPFLLLTDSYSSLQSFCQPKAGYAAQDEKHNKDLLEQKNLPGIKKSDQYSLIAIFSILGGSLLMSSLDLLSMYLSIELQSFALYVLATLNKERLSATSAGLKYFLLGSLSSCFILLGSAIIYSYTGLTQFEAINSLMSVSYFETASSLPGTANTWFNGEKLVSGFENSDSFLGAVSFLSEAGLPFTPAFGWNVGQGAIEINKAFTIGLIIIIIGFLFKISAAPFYQWAPDVYDGTPTIVTVWLTIVVKITILIFLLGVVEFTLPELINNIMDNAPKEEVTSAFTNGSYLLENLSSATDLPKKGFVLENITSIPSTGPVQIKFLLLISSLLSLLIGTIAGLSQIKVKRLLAFSSISHVGFLLLALGIYTQKSVDSFIFYLFQYSVTSLNIFLIFLAFGYLLNNYISSWHSSKRETDLAGQAQPNAATSLITNGSLSTAVSRAITSTPAPDTDKFSSPKDNGSLVDQKTEEDTDINYLIELKGQLYENPVLSVSLAICLFSMAGIPPLIGFFSKQFVLFSSIENGNNFLSIVAILVSVISASYYLRLIKITFFDKPAAKNELVELSWQGPKGAASLVWSISKIHSYIIAILTFLIVFFFLDPSILLNGTQLISLTLFNI